MFNIWLPDDAALRAARVIEINAGLGPSERPPVGSFNELIALYKASPNFQEKAPRTRRDYLRHLTTISVKWGRLPVAGLTRAHVLALRDKGQDTPRQTNYLIQVLRLRLSFAVDRGYRPDNPAIRPGKLKGGKATSHGPITS